MGSGLLLFPVCIILSARIISNYSAHVSGWRRLTGYRSAFHVSSSIHDRLMARLIGIDFDAFDASHRRKYFVA